MADMHGAVKAQPEQGASRRRRASRIAWEVSCFLAGVLLALASAPFSPF